MRKGLLLGAGFSYDLGMPLASEVTEIFLGIFHDENVKSLAAALCAPHLSPQDRPLNAQAMATGFGLLLDYKRAHGSNYKAFLTSLLTLRGLPSPTQSDRDTYACLFGFFYEMIHTLLCLYQDASYALVYPTNKARFGNLASLLSSQETWVFSLNHDLCFEYLALDSAIPITYGDDGALSFALSNLDLASRITFGTTQRRRAQADQPGFFKDRHGINLVKLHGGLSELEYKDGTFLCNLTLDKPNSHALADDFRRSREMGYYQAGQKIGGSREITVSTLDGQPDVLIKSMLSGARKYNATAPLKRGEEKLRIFDAVARRLDQLTIIGYGFDDSHINVRIADALATHAGLQLIIVDPRLQKIPDFLVPHDQGDRIQKAVCSAAQWMDYCATGEWKDARAEENEAARSAVKARVQSQLT